MTNETATSSGGSDFLGLLTIVLITLKLTGVIDWSWWWVLSPVIAGVAFIFLLVAILIIATILQKRRIND